MSHPVAFTYNDSITGEANVAADLRTLAEAGDRPGFIDRVSGLLTRLFNAIDERELIELSDLLFAMLDDDGFNLVAVFRFTRALLAALRTPVQPLKAHGPSPAPRMAISVAGLDWAVVSQIILGLLTLLRQWLDTRSKREPEIQGASL